MGQGTFESWKKILAITGSALAVYLIFRLVLPLLLPFLLAFLVAMLIRPSVRWLRRRLHVKESIGAVLILVSIGFFLIILVNFGGTILLKELQGLLKELQNQEIIENLTKWLNGKGGKKLILFGRDCTIWLADILRKFGEYFTWERCISYCMSHSPQLMRSCISFFTSLFVFFMASVLAVEEMERLHQRLTMCIFYKEIVDFGLFLGKICGKWLRVQGLIMLITTVVSCLGLWISGFSYALLLGIVIGLVDILPIFGTGTIYIPWLIWEFLNQNPGRGLALLILYVICYVTREFMESKLMGKCMGITAFEFLAAVYVGLKLFGAAGFILGPVGVLVIMWAGGKKGDS
ncbi:MAG: AI-2E family transporter [Lachnospiraceae bacterium]|nr:AI-2E family transporter [Lachnospiraceae bacterium]